MPQRRSIPPPPQSVAEWIAEAPKLGRMIAAASVVGGFAALTAVAVRFALTEGTTFLYGTRDVVTGLAAQESWVRVIAPALGGVAAGFVTWLLIRRGGPRVADVMEAVALGRGRPKLRAAAAQAAATVAAVIGGGSI